jgi:hypothetical protein
MKLYGKTFANKLIFLLCEKLEDYVLDFRISFKIRRCTLAGI